MNAVIIQGDHILPVKTRLKYDGPKFIKKLYFPETELYIYICISLYSCNINYKSRRDFLGSNKLNQQRLVRRVRVSYATLPNLFHKALLAVAHTTLHKRIEKTSSLKKSSFQFPQRDFTSTFTRRIWEWIPLQWNRLHL